MHIPSIVPVSPHPLLLIPRRYYPPTQSIPSVNHPPSPTVTVGHSWMIPFPHINSLFVPPKYCGSFLEDTIPCTIYPSPIHMDCGLFLKITITHTIQSSCFPHHAAAHSWKIQFPHIIHLSCPPQTLCLIPRKHHPHTPPIVPVSPIHSGSFLKDDILSHHPLFLSAHQLNHSWKIPFSHNNYCFCLPQPTVTHS